MAGTFVAQASNPTETYFVFQGQTKRVLVNFQNSNNVNYDPLSINLTIYRPNFEILLNEAYSGSSPNVKKSSVGNYYIDLISNGNDYGDYQFIWAWQDTSTSQTLNGFQMISSVPIQVIMISNYLKNQIDKVKKEINLAPIGYNDEQLYMAIQGGLNNINRFPTQTNYTLTTYPYDTDKQLLIDAATVVALQSQSMFSIDTDMNSYSMQGNSMSVDHFSKLQSYASTLQTNLNRHLMHFKLKQLTSGGQIIIQRSVGLRQVMAWQASPSGTSFGSTLGVRV